MQYLCGAARLCLHIVLINGVFFVFSHFVGGTGELSTLCQATKVPNEPILHQNNDSQVVVIQVVVIQVVVIHAQLRTYCCSISAYGHTGVSDLCTCTPCLLWLSAIHLQIDLPWGLIYVSWPLCLSVRNNPRHHPPFCCAYALWAGP